MTLKLKKGEIVVAVFKNKTYSSDIITAAKKMGSVSGNFIYVSLNKPFKPLTQKLKAGRVNISKILFVDGISKSAGQNVEADNCICVESAGALTKLSLIVTKAINSKKFDGLLFDSLSTLLIYNKKEAVTKFVQSMVNKLRKAKMTGAFTALEGDTEEGLLKDIGLFVDEIVS